MKVERVPFQNLKRGDVVVDKNGDSARVDYTRTGKGEYGFELTMLDGDRQGRGVLMSGKASQVVDVSERGEGRKPVDLGEWWPGVNGPKKEK